jgi:hypothetical protein
MSQQRSTEIRFKGTLAFADVNAAARLVEVVNQMLEKSMEVFWKADSQYVSVLSKELAELEDLCWNFVSSAKTQKTQDRQKAIYGDLQRHVGEARATLGEYKSGENWNLGQVEKLEGAFKGLYVSLQSAMNESESEVATSLAKNCGLLIVAAHDMRDKQGTHTWESLIHNVDQVVPVVVRSLKNRVQVTQDPEDKTVLEQAVSEIESEGAHMRVVCHDFRSGRATEAEKNRVTNAVARAAQRAQDVLAKVCLQEKRKEPKTKMILFEAHYRGRDVQASRHRARGLLGHA